MAEANYPQLLFKRAQSMLRVQGILSIVFGGLGVLGGLFFLLLSGFAITEYNSYQISGAFIMGLLVFIFAVLPHIYLVISGIVMVREPAPTVAKTLTIVNLVVSVFWNLVLLIFAIICLTQIGDYERGYKKSN